MKIIIYITVCVFCSCFTLLGQKLHKDTTFTKKNSIEGSLLLPFYPGNELLLKYTRTLWERLKMKGEFVTGIHFHLNTRRDGGRYDDYQVILGYRQFLIKNLFLESAIQPKLYYRFQDSPFSNKTHEGFGLFAYTMLGYRFEPIKLSKFTYFINIQPIGIALGFYHSDNWPKNANGNTNDDFIYYGNIAIGIRF